ncbi:hypothetical protein Tco_1246177 [Tanacetum coccineum]
MYREPYVRNIYAGDLTSSWFLYISGMRHSVPHDKSISKESHPAVHNFVNFMEVEPDIENMTLEEYLKYESEKESRLQRSDITIEDVEKLRQILTPPYNATATDPILDELLEEFKDELLNIVVVATTRGKRIDDASAHAK